MFIFSTGQSQSSITLTRISPNDIINGGVICPNFYPVEITCVGTEVAFLQWRRNTTNIGGFTAASSSQDDPQVEPFTLILDSIITRDNNVANMTSRLRANISDVNSGDRITCIAGSMQDTTTLNYVLRGKLYKLNHQPLYSNHFLISGRPPEVPTNYSVTLQTGSTTVDMSITWDSAFNTAHDVTSYRVVASGGSAASCPSSCNPSGLCRCTGLGIGENTTITVTAINCGNQMGPPAPILTRPRGRATSKVKFVSACTCIALGLIIQFQIHPQNVVFYQFTLQ